MIAGFLTSKVGPKPLFCTGACLHVLALLISFLPLVSDKLSSEATSVILFIIAFIGGQATSLIVMSVLYSLLSVYNQDCISLVNGLIFTYFTASSNMYTVLKVKLFSDITDPIYLILILLSNIATFIFTGIIYYRS